ncbi:MAG TPA: nucleoside-diphosphate sugar epimerase/dehydratase [Euzebya sp.]|nr:nucleoside-diphosphate sugar epimerase/dehydratase [Euzebya sp.]
MATATAKMRSDLPLALLDGVLIGAAYLLVFVLRFDGSVPTAYWAGFRLLLPLALAVHLSANAASGLYGQVWRHASVIEARRVVTAAAGAFVVIALSAGLIGRHQVPLSVPLVGAALAPLLVGGLRFQTRLFALRRRGVADDAPVRVVVVGAGSAGGKLIRDMQHHPEMGLLPVAAVDDDLALIGRSIGSVPVFGPLEMLPGVVRRFGADQAVLAIDGADGELVRRVANLADEAGVTLKVMPPTKELVSGRLSVRDVRDVQIADLLGRGQIQTDLAQVRATIAGKRVLVTGAGGSIGSEILVQVAGLGPASLIALDCDETHLFDAAALVDGACTQVLADVRDHRQVKQAFDAHRPEVVFHAAALKHVPILEAHPSQAVATNVVGTRNVVRAARAAGVERFVLISTDKAVNPSSVMGATKQLAEQVLLAEAPQGLPWSAVRFGNVLGSRGSVVPTFMRQIAAGGPVTVTDVNMTRYFMTIPEAVQLVLQSSALSGGNDLFMLDMGQPVKILDLAYRMIRLSGRRPHTDVKIQITGMRPGEKLAEELRTGEEATAGTTHSAVIRVLPNRMSRSLLDDGIAALEDTLGDEARTRRTLTALVSGSVAREHADEAPIPEHTGSLLPTE